MELIERADVLFSTVMARFMTIPARRRAAKGVSVAQFKALCVMDFLGTPSLGRLSEALGVSMPAASEIVDRLVRTGCAARERSPQDRRQVKLSVTAGGRAVLQRFARERRERFRKLHGVVGRKGILRMVSALSVLESILSRWREA